MIRGVIFDLDGTLANTASLGSGMRKPFMVLGDGVNDDGLDVKERSWKWNQSVSDIPAILIERGYRVAIATRAPEDYASTLIHLIGCDYELLEASCGNNQSKAERIKKTCQGWGLRPDEVIYCGDLSDDERIAALAGTLFLGARELRSADVLHRFPRRRSDGALTGDVRLDVLSENSATESFFKFREVVVSRRQAMRDSDLALLSNYLSERVESPADFRQQGLNLGPSGYRAAMSYWLLKNLPAIPCRRDLQLDFFAHSSEIDREVVCSLDGARFGVDPRIISKREIRMDPQLRIAYLDALLRMWPSIEDSQKRNIHAVVRYDTDAEFGRVLGRAKNYGKHSGISGDRFRSGDRVMLGYIDFVAELIASRVSRDVERPLVPVPASGFTERQPGQFSVRLARRVADLSRRQLVPLLSRVGDDFVLNDVKLRPPKSVDLIDDQVTYGTTIDSCRSVLARAGISINRVFCYSASSRVLTSWKRPDVIDADTRIHALEQKLIDKDVPRVRTAHTGTRHCMRCFLVVPHGPLGCPLDDDACPLIA